MPRILHRVPMSNPPGAENASLQSSGTAKLRASGELEAFVERRIAAHRRSHQETVAFAEHALHVAGVDVRMADHDIVLLAGVDHPLHPFEHLRVLILPGIAELLGEVAFANENGADA